MKRLAQGVALLAAVVALTAVGCALFFGPSAEELTEIRGTLTQGEDVLVLDVRSPEEFAENHLEGAVNMPHGQVGERLDEVGPTSRHVIVYCKSGVRASWAADTLREAGYTHVQNLGGISNGPEVGLRILEIP